MLFVNHAGKEPQWIAHAPWNGLHLADLVMPCFLLIVGMSTALSLTAGRRRGAATSDLLHRVLSRAGVTLLSSCKVSPLEVLLALPAQAAELETLLLRPVVSLLASQKTFAMATSLP